MKRDVVTLQIGTTANYIGAHFWNLHDEYLATPPLERELAPATFFRDVPPRSSAGLRGLQYAPRLQVIDADGAFGALSTDEGSVLQGREDDSKVQPIWSKDIQRYVREPIQPSQYISQLLAEERGDDGDDIGDEAQVIKKVTYWSDYLKTRFHPRTCTPLRGFHHGVSNMDMFEIGSEIASSSVVEDTYEHLRYFVEECDSFGGLCIIANADDAYAGFTDVYLRYLQDELGAASPMLVFGSHNEKRGYSTRIAADRLRTQNEAKLVATCHELSAEYVPFVTRNVERIPLLHVEKQNLFHSSSILGAVMHTALTPLQQSLSLAGFVSAIQPAPFASYGAVGCHFPSPLGRLEFKNSLLSIPGAVSLSEVHLEGTVAKNTRNGTATAALRSVTPEITSARGLGYSLPIYANVTAPITLPVPFPRIFDPALERGYLAPRDVHPDDEDNGSGPADVEQVAAVAGLSTLRAEGYRALSALSKAITPTTRKTAAQLAGVEDEELKELAEKLEGLGRDYLSI
eukprot:GFKZ01014300.1.p1 GENE.GFKZ01014300.1~~GFKZ01014300.1.p1  ORF type:complete len:515 (-),score=68.56 GFKZ01014300.1:1258-2802(-)